MYILNKEVYSYKVFIDNYGKDSDILEEVRVIDALFSARALTLEDDKDINVTNQTDIRMKRKSNDRIYFDKKVLLDSGANISAMSNERYIKDIRRDRLININGSTGNGMASVIGLCKEFGSTAVLLEGLKFNIASLSDIQRNHQITFINSKGIFVARRLKSNIYYIFSVEDGLSH